MLTPSCDVVRRKIEAHTKKPGVTRAALLRDLAGQLELQSVSLQSKQLERLRLAEDKPKSEHRKRMGK